MKRQNFPGRKQDRRRGALMRRTRDLGRYLSKNNDEKADKAQADVDVLRTRVRA